MFVTSAIQHPELTQQYVMWPPCVYSCAHCTQSLGKLVSRVLRPQEEHNSSHPVPVSPKPQQALQSFTAYLCSSYR